MFTDSDTINAVVRENSGLAGKILNKIQFMIAENKLRKSGTSEAKAMLQAEKLYVKAFRDAKKQESIDVKANKASSDVEYSRKTASSYDVDKVTQSTYDKYMWAIESGNITPKEYGRFFSVIGDTIHGNIELQNPDGVYVVLSYDENNSPSLLIGTDGNIKNPSTEFVVRISEELNNNERELVQNEFRRSDFEQARTIIEASYGDSSVSISSRIDAKSYEEFYSKRRERHPGTLKQSGRTDARNTSELRIVIGRDSGVAGNQPGVSDTGVTADPLPENASTWDDLRGNSESENAGVTERYYGNDSFDNLIKLGLPKKSNTTTPDVSTTPLAPATPTAPAPQPNSNVGNTWDTAVQDYGVIGQSMNPRAREIDVPQRTTADNRISDFLCSALESPQIRDEWVADVNSDAMLAGYYRGRRADSLEYREVKADYSVRWLKLSVELVEYPNSKDIEVYLMYEDINETKRT